ncbi:alpha/beta hydrolase [uncultured Helicobacter sp.]|uniref:alpha/beta hydrolase n=1 Tax=uncultured Helicobacter sp. TaxID=175537 RepID=UPI00374F8D36
MRSIFRKIFVCVAVCGVLWARPSQEIESLSPLANAYFSIQTRTIGEYEIFIAKPKTNATKYPALVVLDGNAHFPIIINQYIMHQYTPTDSPLLIVGIGYKGGLAYDTPRRTRDYTPMAKDGKGGGAARFYEVLRTQILPLVRDDVGGELSAIGFFGHSFGGLFGLYVFLHHQEMFSHYMIASPSLWWGNIEIPSTFLCRATLAFSHGANEPNKGGMSLTEFIKALSVQCPEMCASVRVFAGGHGDSIKPSIVLMLSELLGGDGFSGCKEI